jgi:hypothetical protein
MLVSLATSCAASSKSSRSAEVVCVPRPALYPVDGELQGVAWAKGETYNLRNRLMNNSLA